MALNIKTFPQMVSDQAVTAQAASPARSLDFGIGTTLRALAEGFASIGMWLQFEIAKLLASTRAASSQGADLDSWMRDYRFERNGAQAAKGVAIFGRYTATQSALIRAGTQGAQIKTLDAAWTYIVSPGGSGYDSTLGGYLIPAGQTTIALPVEAVTAGAGGNAAPNTVGLLASAIAGIDYVSNATALVGGVEAESDMAYRMRFWSYLGSLSRGTELAINYAISTVQPGLSWSFQENVKPDGAAQAAFFTITVDDGSGAPSNDLLTRVSQAVAAYRAVGVSYAVIAPTVIEADVSMVVETKLDRDNQAARAAAADALTAYINALPMGEVLPYTRLPQVAYDASPLITKISGVLLNDDVADIGGEPRQAVRPGIITVN